MIVNALHPDGRAIRVITTAVDPRLEELAERALKRARQQLPGVQRLGVRFYADHGLDSGTYGFYSLLHPSTVWVWERVPPAHLPQTVAHETFHAWARWRQLDHTEHDADLFAEGDNRVVLRVLIGNEPIHIV